MPIWKALVTDLKSGYIYIQADNREDAIRIGSRIHIEDLEPHLTMGSNDLFVFEDSVESVPEEWKNSEPFGSLETCLEILEKEKSS